MIIFISGSINAGKSTIAKLLAEKIPQTANIEIDALRDFIPWLELEKAVPINLENAILLIQNFTKHGYNVVVPYPISQKNYEYVTRELWGGDVVFITLSPDIKKALSDNPNRVLDEWERNRIQHHYTIWIATPTFGKIFDTTNQTPEETVEEILAYLGSR